MVLDSKIETVKHHFGILDPEDWQEIEPGWILGIHGIGRATLDHIRIYLAARGLTLKDDHTPNYWNQHFAETKIGGQLGTADIAITAPFTVLIDSQEQQPFTFQGLWCDSPHAGRPLIVLTKWKPLGESMGDYAIQGFEGECHVERKSMDDAHGTFLGWGERRERFERELATLAGLPAAAIVVECTLGQLIQNVPDRGKKTKQENAKILHRQILAWQQDYRIPWYFCDGRRLAEVSTFRILERFWNHRNHQKKHEVKQLEEALAEL